jgi:hypothetical protein
MRLDIKGAFKKAADTLRNRNGAMAAGLGISAAALGGILVPAAILIHFTPLGLAADLAAAGAFAVASHVHANRERQKTLGRRKYRDNLVTPS